MKTQWILWYAIILHLVWGVLMLGWPASINTTPTAGIVETFGSRWLTGAVLISAALLALHELWRANFTIFGLLSLLPQQALLILGAGGALDSILVSQYADGVLRPREFIFTDQFPALLAAFMHTVALVSLFGRNTWRTLAFRLRR